MNMRTEWGKNNENSEGERKQLENDNGLEYEQKSRIISSLPQL